MFARGRNVTQQLLPVQKTFYHLPARNVLAVDVFGTDIAYNKTRTSLLPCTSIFLCLFAPYPNPQLSRYVNCTVHTWVENIQGYYK